MSNVEAKTKSFIEIIHWNDRDFEERFIKDIEITYQDVKSLVDGLPNVLKIYFDHDVVDSRYAVDGHAHARDIVTLILNKKSSFSADEYKKQLREVLFHELFHVRQNFTYEDEIQSAINGAVYEGCATIFAREYADARPPHGNYSVESEETLAKWYDEMKKITAKEYFDASGDMWQKWAFYDQETGERWKIYKTGTWIVNEVLKKRALDIVDLKDVSPAQILQWFED